MKTKTSLKCFIVVVLWVFTLKGSLPLRWKDAQMGRKPVCGGVGDKDTSVESHE